jgi:hypothetical protein
MWMAVVNTCGCSNGLIVLYSQWWQHQQQSFHKTKALAMVDSMGTNCKTDIFDIESLSPY